MKKRNACGIVVEYNPLHTGHIHHIQQSRIVSQCDVLIAVMSPYFVQRGDIAILSPYHRAKAAIQQGVDLVVELPYPYCTQHADKFAFGAIKVLEQLAIDSLCFGSESNQIDELKQALIMNENTIDQPIKQTGESLAKMNPNDASNDILGIAYLKALKHTSIKPLTIQRTNTYRSDQITSRHASASALRRSFYENQGDSSLGSFTPLYEVMTKESLPSLKEYYDTLRYCLLTMPVNYLQGMFLMDEGIEGLFIKQARTYDNFDDFLNACVSKRYTKARITRTLTHLLLQTTKEKAKQLEDLQFVRILAMNENGRQYLKEIKALKKEYEKNIENNQTSINNVHQYQRNQTQCKESTVNLEQANQKDKTTYTLVNRFNQLPSLYQEEVMKQIHVIYNKTDIDRHQEAIQQELSYPIMMK